jgi:molecular chaperone GrpE
MSEAVKPKDDESKNPIENENIGSDANSSTSSEGPKVDKQDEVFKDENDSENTTDTSLNNSEEVDYKSIIDDLNDKILRTAAELQNVKRRAQQDVQKARDYSIESFAKEMLSVMDNLQRATESITIENAENDEKLKQILDGVEITKKEMLNVFSRNQIKCIDPLGEKFNHNYHQAMSQIEDSEKESGTVVNVMQTGYVIKDRLIRPALVIVVK